MSAEASPPHAPRPSGSPYAQVLRIPAFRALWISQMLATFGEAVARVALPLLAFDMTNSARMASQVLVASLLPMVVLAPISGVLVDRLDRKKLMIVTDVVRAVLVLSIPFCREAWQVAVVAMLVATNDAIWRPAALAAVPVAVPPGQLVTALSITQVGSNILRVAGPAIGGVIVGFAGPRPAFFLQGACFLLAAIAMVPMVLPPIVEPTERERISAAMWQGLSTVKSNPVVRGIAAVEALWQTMTAVLSIALVAYCVSRFGETDASDETYALITTVFALGTVVGALVAHRAERRMGRPMLMAVGYLAPLLAVPMVFNPPMPIVFVLWFGLGFADAWAVIGMQAYLAEAIPDHLRGRTYAAWTAVVTLGAAVAYLVVGWMASAIGAGLTISLVGLLVGIGGPILLWVTGGLRAMRKHSAELVATA